MNKFTSYLKNVFSLKGHMDVEAADAAIRSNIPFKGPNVYILACAIIIASVGLNVNSIPVIIGAMLVSPLMSPIIGFGLGLGTNDMDLVKSGLKNLGIMVAISILASTLYFVISPLKLLEPTELLARTNPTIYDVLIALFGGVAGMLETSRKDKGTVISGVAIATALMPPLCTVGYGISVLNLHYTFGALYLFLINCIFIALAVFLTSKYLGFPSKSYSDAKTEKRRKRSIAILVVLIIIPSCFSAFNIIRTNNFSIRAENLIKKHKTIGKSYIYDSKIHTEGKTKTFNVELYIAGDELSSDQKEIVLVDAENMGLKREQIVFREEASDNSSKITETEIVRGIYEYYDKRIQELTDTITSLRLELAKARAIVEKQEIVDTTKVPQE